MPPPHNHFSRPKAFFLPQTSNREKGLAFFSHCKTVLSPPLSTTHHPFDLSSCRNKATTGCCIGENPPLPPPSITTPPPPLDLDSTFPDLKFILPDLLCTVPKQPTLLSDLVCLTAEEKMGGFHHSHLPLNFSSPVFKPDVGEFLWLMEDSAGLEQRPTDCVVLRDEVVPKVWNVLFDIVEPAMLQEKLIFGVQSCNLLPVWCGKNIWLIPRGLGLLTATEGYKALPWKPPDAESFADLLFYVMFLFGALPQTVFGNQHFLVMTPFPEVAQHQALRDLVDYVPPPMIYFSIVPQSHFDAWGLVPFIGIGKDVKGGTVLVYVDPELILPCYFLP